MMNLGIDMKVTCKTGVVLARLKENRAQHSRLVAEARQGYLVKAKEALEAKLRDVGEGKVTRLHFVLEPPQDHTKIYDTAIAMLGAHTGDLVELGPDEFRHLMEDDWDWSERWAASNSAYSAGTAAVAAAKGYVR